MCDYNFQHLLLQIFKIKLKMVFRNFQYFKKSVEVIFMPVIYYLLGK